MQPEIPQTAAPDANEAALQTLPAVTQTESAPAPVAPLEATEANPAERAGRRVLRASPAVLISCGILFVSLIFLLNLMTRTGTTSARRGAETPAAPGAQEAHPKAATAAPEEVARANAPAPKPSAQAAPAVEVASVVPKETEKQAPQPAPAATPAVKETQAPAQPQPDAAKPQSQDGFTLQIGSYNALAQAQERVNELGAAGVSAYVARVEIPKRGTWYRVQVGHFGSREEASRYGTQLRSKGAVADFIISPSKAS